MVKLEDILNSLALLADELDYTGLSKTANKIDDLIKFAFKLKEDARKYNKDYQLKRYHNKRKQIVDMLGGKCAINSCGEVNDLQFDHVEPNKKMFAITKLWSLSPAKLQEELDKCQLLCRKHHNEKSIRDAGKLPAKGIDRHGTLSTARYCKCELCREARNHYNREYRKLFKKKRKKKK